MFGSPLTVFTLEANKERDGVSVCERETENE